MSSTPIAQPPDLDASEPEALRVLAASLGDGVRFVQGAGGNISLKEADVLWVKASGTRFADAGERSIFVRMDLGRAQERALHDEDLRSCCLDSSATNDLRPSIEAAFHALMPQPVVVHVHSVGAVAAAVSALDHARRRLEHLGRVVTVPYRRPGRPLAAAIVDAGANEGRATSDCIVLLANHGLIVAAVDPARVIQLVHAVEEVLAPGPLLAREESSVREAGRVRMFAPGTLHPEARSVLLDGVLTPDSAVFLGARPFGTGEDASALCIASDDGAVWVPDLLSADAAEVVESLVNVAGLVAGSPSYLMSSEVGELVDWDAEKWRREQQR